MMKQIKSRNAYSKIPVGVYVLLLAMIAIFFISSQGRVSPSHLLNVLRQTAPLGIAAIGQTLVLLMGGIDLSVGTVITMVNVLSTDLMNGNPNNILFGVMVTMSICALIGLMNGFIIARFKMPAFIITMATSTIIQGGYYVYTKGIPRGSIPQAFRVISEGWLGPIPIAAIIWLLVWAAFSFILHKTPYGKRFYITGGNQRTAYLSGISSESIAISAYVLCSILAGIAGLILAAFVGVPSTSVGDTYTLNSIASSVIGGTSFAGGIGTLEGTFPGVLIMVLLQSTLTILNFPEAGKSISQGLVIAVMVGINLRQRRVKVRRK